MSKAVKSDKKMQRAMLALFRDIAAHGQVNAEKAIRVETVRVCDRKSLQEIRDLYVAFCNEPDSWEEAKPETLALLDEYLSIRQRQSPAFNKPTEADVKALYADGIAQQAERYGATKEITDKAIADDE